MNASIKSLGIDRLPVEERLALVEEIWDSIAADNAAVPRTDAQRAELEKRIEEDDTNPDNVTPWEEVKAATLARLRKQIETLLSGHEQRSGAVNDEQERIDIRRCCSRSMRGSYGDSDDLASYR